MEQAETHNAEGNEAFECGDYAKAAACYFAAVKHDGKVAKYRTNLANTLIHLKRASEALEEAAAAIAVDAAWPKGFLFKALAYEKLGDLDKALAACAEGLKLHRHHPSLEEAHRRLQKQKLQTDKQQQRQQQAHKPQLPVQYVAKVRDATGQVQSFTFTHMIAKDRLQQAQADVGEATRIIQDVSMPHYREMLTAKRWQCVECGALATKLFLHPMSYLHKDPSTVVDFGPSPACSSQHCATQIHVNVREAMGQLGTADFGSWKIGASRPNELFSS